ncbi:4-phosphopantetheinyl transferase family protein, partial [bacterium]|nr:4-phosphopantetheinyl transferase family protein [bacterium]
SDKDLIATLIWSGKEAVLKALSLGLNLDTRSIEIRIDGSEKLPTSSWHKLEIQSAVKQASSLCLFWRSEDDYVLTLCTLSGQALDFVRMDPGVSDLQVDIGEPEDRS